MEKNTVTEILFHSTPLLGCDPEFFFTKDGSVIGAENILNKENPGNTLIIDGIQAEINPKPETCRQFLANNIAECIKLAASEAKKQGATLDFSQAKTLSKKELKTASKENRALGCKPSESAYKSRAILVKNKEDYPHRAGAGHIHIGGGKPRQNALQEAIHTNTVRFVEMLDIIVGNTCVMLDTDPANRIRRRTYGRAGEYRIASHGGLEYRVLSNFWLKNYVIMSLVFGLTRQAAEIMMLSNKESATDKYADFEKQIRRKTNMRDIRRAINQNNPALARRNFEKIAPILSEIFTRDSHPLWKGGIEDFRFFATHKGLDKWFRTNPATHWTKIDAEQSDPTDGNGLYKGECAHLERRTKPRRKNRRRAQKQRARKQLAEKK